MLTRFIKRQLLIFAVLGTAALVFSVVTYTDTTQRLGINHMTVSARFKDTSGLYPRALVTYRGVEVGKVASVDLAPGGTTVRMGLDDRYDIPRDVAIELHSTSAIGEQYVDLVPRRSAGPYLRDGDVVGSDRTVEMPQITPVLESLNALLQSVPRQQTTDVLDEVDTALGGSGEDLGSLIDETSSVVHEAQSQVQATTSLVRTASPLLKTQEHIGPRLVSSIASLASFTGRLQESDDDVRALLDTTPGAAKNAETLIEELRPTLPALLANTQTVGSVANTYTANTRSLLITYPALQARLQAALLPHRDESLVKLDLKTNINNPPSCTTGYIDTQERRDPSDTSLTGTPTNQHCDLRRASPEGVRGLRNALCPNDPSRRAATPAECGLVFGRGRSLEPAGQQSASRVETSVSGPVDPSTLFAPTDDGDRVSSWRDLLTGPVGR